MQDESFAIKYRPQSIKDLIGQTHLLNPGCVIYQMIAKKHLHSAIFFGLPGIGKTSLAIAICKDLKYPYDIFNATNDNKEKLKKLIDRSKKEENFVLILEEIHRLNKDKQDILLPIIENDLLKILATTTENPYFTINSAIRSRCLIFELQRPELEDLIEFLKKLIKKIDSNWKLSLEIIEIIARHSNGDVRVAINSLELIYHLYGKKEIALKNVKALFENNSYQISRYGDSHYDTLSAFHKSMRGSDPDAAIYYLAKLILSKDLIAISRRIMACVYEDVGLANPNLCQHAYIAIETAKQLGFPECNQVLANIVIEICLSPKSNSAYLAINDALKDLKNGHDYEPPNHIKDQSYQSAKKLGRKNYLYPHNYKYAWINQAYLPKELKAKKYYVPKNLGKENLLNDYLRKIKVMEE